MEEYLENIELDFVGSIWNCRRANEMIMLMEIKILYSTNNTIHPTHILKIKRQSKKEPPHRRDGSPDINRLRFSARDSEK